MIILKNKIIYQIIQVLIVWVKIIPKQVIIWVKIIIIEIEEYLVKQIIKMVNINKIEKLIYHNQIYIICHNHNIVVNKMVYHHHIHQLIIKIY